MDKKRLVVFAISAFGLVMPSLRAQADQVRTPVSFTLTPALCSNLQVTVVGTGDSFLVTNQRIDNNGVVHINRNDLVTGTAVDTEGTSYIFNYHNHANIEVPQSGFPFQFTTTDHFNLIGDGKASSLHVSFVARVTFPSPGAPPIAEFVNSRGNPMFCDPI
jgi:hypothetical protein